MDGPVAVRQLSVLDRVVSDRGEAVAARLPGQNDFASLDFLLRDHWAAGGLRSCCRTRAHTAGVPVLPRCIKVLLKVLKCNTQTSLLRGDHQRLGRLPPSLAGLSGESEHVDRLGLQRRCSVLPRARAQHVHRGAVAVGRVPPVRDLISCRARRERDAISVCASWSRAEEIWLRKPD